MGYFEHDKNGKNISIRVGHDVEYERFVKKADKLQRRANKNLERRINREYRRGSSISAIVKVVLILLCVSLVISFLRKGNMSNAFTFESMLEFLSTVPTVNWNWLHIGDVATVLVDLPDWLSWLQASWLVTVMNFIGGLIEFFGFIMAGLWQALAFIMHFLRFFFFA